MRGKRDNIPRIKNGNERLTGSAPVLVPGSSYLVSSEELENGFYYDHVPSLPLTNLCVSLIYERVFFFFFRFSHEQRQPH